jgi:hypothetical protein
MEVVVRPTGQLRDELTRNAETFRQPLESLLTVAPLRVAHMLYVHRRSGGLPGILRDHAIYCLPFESLDDYREQPFALMFTQAGQNLLPPSPVPGDTLTLEVKDAILEKLASLTGAGSSIEAYGYGLWFFNRILNLAREDYPGGMPGFWSLAKKEFQAFFAMEACTGVVELIAWDECHKFMAVASRTPRLGRPFDQASLNKRERPGEGRSRSDGGGTAGEGDVTQN